MREHLRKLWESRSPRERRIIVVLGAVLAIASYVWLIQAASHARARLTSSVAMLRTQAVRVDLDAAELARVRSAPVPPAPQTDLRAQLQSQADAAGIAGSLLRTEVVDENQVRVVFGSIAFAEWLAWVARLQAQHVRLDTGRIEALSTPGLVSATATFVRAKPQ